MHRGSGFVNAEILSHEGGRDGGGRLKKAGAPPNTHLQLEAERAPAPKPTPYQGSLSLSWSSLPNWAGSSLQNNGYEKKNAGGFAKICR